MSQEEIEPMQQDVEGEEREARITALAGDLEALASVPRLHLLHLLTRPRYGEEMGAALGTSRQSALKHVAKLEEHGFVRSMHGWRESGPVVEFVTEPSRIFALTIELTRLARLQPQQNARLRPVERTVRLDADAPSRSESASGTTRSLLTISGPTAGASFPLESARSRWTIGRGEDRDLRVDKDPFVSSRHAEVQVDAGRLYVVDSYSANGTFLNFTRVPRGGRLPVQPGDVIGVGHTLLVVQGPPTK